MELTWMKSWGKDRDELERLFALVEQERLEKKGALNGRPMTVREIEEEAAHLLDFAKLCNASHLWPEVARAINQHRVTEREAAYLELKVRINQEQTFAAVASEASMARFLAKKDGIVG